MPRRQKYSVASQTVRIPQNAINQVKHLCLILDGGGTVFAKAVVPTSEGAKLVEFSYSQQGVEVIAEHQSKDETEVERWVGSLRCGSEIEATPQLEPPTVGCVAATAVAAVEAFLGALLKPVRDSAIADEDEDEEAAPVVIEIACEGSADAGQDLSGYFVTNSFFTNNIDDQLSVDNSACPQDKAAAFYVVNSYCPCEPVQSWMTAAQWEVARTIVTGDGHEDEAAEQTTGVFGVVVEGGVEDESVGDEAGSVAGDGSESVAESVAVTEVGLEMEVETVSTDEAEGEAGAAEEVVYLTSAAAIEDVNDLVNEAITSDVIENVQVEVEQAGVEHVNVADIDRDNEMLEVDGKETADLSFDLNDPNTEEGGSEDLLGKSAVDLEELQQFAVRIFESWKALSGDVWGQPITLEAIYDQGFRSMLVLSFLSQLAAVHEQQIDTVWGRLILTKRPQDGDLLKVGKQTVNGLTFTKIIKPKQPVPQGHVIPQPQWDKSGDSIIPGGFVPLKVTDTFTPSAESSALGIDTGAEPLLELPTGFVTEVSMVTKPIAYPVTKPETVAVVVNGSTPLAQAAIDSSNRSQPDLQNVPVFLRQLRQRKKT